MNKRGRLVGGVVACGLALAAPPAMTGTKPSPSPAAGRVLVLAMMLNLDEGELGRWKEIQAARRPSHLAALAEAFRGDFPGSSRQDEAKALEAAAIRSIALKREVGLSGDYFETVRGDEAFDAALLRAVRGDGEAAYRVARAYIDGRSGVFASMYRHEQWLRFAGALGHARACWELAQLYNVYGRVAEAASYEKRALALGYKPAPRLSTRDY